LREREQVQDNLNFTPWSKWKKNRSTLEGETLWRPRGPLYGPYSLSHVLHLTYVFLAVPVSHPLEELSKTVGPGRRNGGEMEEKTETPYVMLCCFLLFVLVSVDVHRFLDFL